MINDDFVIVGVQTKTYIEWEWLQNRDRILLFLKCIDDASFKRIGHFLHSLRLFISLFEGKSSI